MKVRQEMLLSPRPLRLRFCRRNGARTFFRLRRRCEFSTLRALIAEARDLGFVIRLLVDPLRLFVGPLRLFFGPLCRASHSSIVAFCCSIVVLISAVDACVYKAENCCRSLQLKTLTVDELGAH